MTGTDITASSCNGATLPEPDSDEDDDHSSQAFNDLAQSASMTFSTTSTSSGDVRSRSRSESAAPPTLAELFPPPPSPLPLAVLESDPYAEEIPLCDLTAKSTYGQTTARPPPCTCPAPTSAKHSVDQHQKGPPPAPPKRSENTRLTTTTVRASKANSNDFGNLRRPNNGFPSMHLQSYQTASSEYCEIYGNSEPNYSNRAQYFGQSKKLNAYQ
uniref:Uncharacterized protein n=1 Tax=Romanomermis culicivorax TaxID=13658 RepID=A0A915K4R1_ROMCU